LNKVSSGGYVSAVSPNGQFLAIANTSSKIVPPDQWTEVQKEQAARDSREAFDAEAVDSNTVFRSFSPDTIKV
jgi:hypothetical protein